MSLSIAKLMSSAKESLLISSPYFIPRDEGIKLFKVLREKNIEVTIVTNSLVANDVIAVHSGYMDYRKALLERSVRLYELKAIDSNREIRLLGSSNASLHAKGFFI